MRVAFCLLPQPSTFNSQPRERGLRVSEPLNLRLRDVSLEAMQLVIRGAKGGKDRVVPIPCSVAEDLHQQIEAARATCHRDRNHQIPVALPHHLAVKYPQAPFDGNWAWLFPAHVVCLDPRVTDAEF